jgi:hypothetical protein
MSNVCVVCLEPWGNQEFDVNSLYDGAKGGTYLYLVHASTESLHKSVDAEDFLYRYRELYPDGYEDEDYCKAFETVLTELGIGFTRLPDKSFTVYSTLM